MWLTFFEQKNINVFVIFQGRNFNIMLPNNFVKFEQLGPDVKIFRLIKEAALSTLFKSYWQRTC